ncbi:MAG TPA: hypothetical protein VNN09_12005, partial [Candidatus Competibacteraceae bacterium]|nr:hypothetical protein [Candidatus Competibacteraceae bacterium]
MGKTLYLLIPGLLGPWPEADRPGFPCPRLPALERLLARGEGKDTASRGLEASLARLFGLEGGELPVAAITRLAEGGEPDREGWWLRADPVHLKADLHQIVLFDARHLQLRPDEAAALAAAFNRTFAGDGLILETPHPERWYLRLAADPGITTVTLAEAVGRDINPLLPAGPEARRWRALLTEIQMLFHLDPVNQAREAAGQPEVNSLWLWGGGRLPARLAAPVAALYAAD